MDLGDLRDEVDAIRPDEAEPTEGMLMMVTKLGHAAEHMLRIRMFEKAAEAEDVDEDDLGISERDVDRVQRDALGGVLVAAIEFAEENDIDVTRAVEDRLDSMERAKQQYELLSEMEGGEADPLGPEDDRTFH